MVAEVNDTNFDEIVLKSDLPALVDFWGCRCAACKVMLPIIEELVAEYFGKVRIVKMSVNDNPVTPRKFGIRSIPTLLIFKDGKIMEQFVGAVSKKTITSILDRHIHANHS